MHKLLVTATIRKGEPMKVLDKAMLSRIKGGDTIDPPLPPPPPPIIP